MIIRVGKERYLIENKRFVAGKKQDPVKEILTTFSKGINPVRDKRAYDRASYRLKALKRDFNRGITGLVKDLYKGEINDNQFRHHARILFKSSYYRAYELGTEATGLNLNYFKLPDGDYKWLDKVRTEEYKYLEKFIADVLDREGTMSYEKRAKLYGEKLDSIFTSGRVDAMPSSGTKIHWILGASDEICPDCQALANGGPYTKETLPTTPKAGDTQCLFNCNCTLRVDYETPKESFIKISKYSGNLDDDIDWDSVDEVMSILHEQSNLQSTPEGIMRVRELVEEFNEASRKINIDPFSRDFVLAHRLGAYVKKVGEGG